MGYLVGRICHQTQEQAQNATMSQVVPSIDANGKLNAPHYNGTDWTFNGQSVKLTFPQCTYGEYADLGLMMGETMVSAMSSVLIVVALLKAIKLI